MAWPKVTLSFGRQKLVLVGEVMAVACSATCRLTPILAGREMLVENIV